MKKVLALAVLLVPAPLCHAAEPSQPTTTPPALQFTGKGDRATKSFELSPGLVTWDVKYQGPSVFRVTLFNEAGEDVGMWVNEIGDCQQTHAANIRNAGKYRLQVGSSGEWSITVKQPKPDATVSAPEPFTGKGGNVTRFFVLGAGSHVVESVHKGTGVFRVKLRDTDGNLFDEPVAVIGTYDGSRILKLTKPGVFLIDVFADGDWTVSID